MQLVLFSATLGLKIVPESIEEEYNTSAKEHGRDPGLSEEEYISYARGEGYDPKSSEGVYNPESSYEKIVPVLSEEEEDSARLESVADPSGYENASDTTKHLSDRPVEGKKLHFFKQLLVMTCPFNCSGCCTRLRFRGKLWTLQHE